MSRAPPGGDGDPFPPLVLPITEKEDCMSRRRDDSGQGNTEYALLIVVVLAIFLVIVGLTQTNAPGFFTALWERLMAAVRS